MQLISLAWNELEIDAHSSILSNHIRGRGEVLRVTSAYKKALRNHFELVEHVFVPEEGGGWLTWSLTRKCKLSFF